MCIDGCRLLEAFPEATVEWGTTWNSGQKLEKQSFFADTQANATKALPAKALVAKKASTNTSGLTSMSLGPRWGEQM